MLKTLFIAGTDTDAGKTVFTTALAAYLQKYRSQNTLGIMKPIQSGIGDRQLYQRLFSLSQSEAEITPLYFQAPLAPPLAAAKENREIDLGLVWKTFTQLQQNRDFLLVEALGGLGSPVTDEFTVADLAGEWRLPTVLVVPVRLGAISQVVTSVALAKQAKVQLLGIILNCCASLTPEQIADWTPVDMIESFTNIPVLGCLPYLENPEDLDKLAQLASDFKLEKLFN
ncbi:MAG: dethiobiotin synthase [Cyanobacteria bacterium P01_D01_bin.116]